ncbi:hypothetical protein POTOM_045418 [Populus tomentosa]|uniref:Uncharacterized protein n=1 Tax=Populus tomentosa TaxID=118781 RepID=A0A8X7YLX4_POPTO|nr:hypothetical protein POTOM_045418 [Populus tomentosa]
MLARTTLIELLLCRMSDFKPANAFTQQPATLGGCRYILVVVVDSVVLAATFIRLKHAFYNISKFLYQVGWELVQGDSDMECSNPFIEVAPDKEKLEDAIGYGIKEGDIPLNLYVNAIYMNSFIQLDIVSWCLRIL